MLFLGLISPISLGLKTFMFPWVLGVHAGSYHLLSKHPESRNVGL